MYVKLSLDSQEQEDWFNGLNKIQALTKDNWPINSNLPFTTSIDNSYGKTGVIRILLPQTNFYSRGRYQLNLASSYSKETKTIPVHLVDNRTFTMKLNTLNMNIKTGECFAFIIEGPNGETFGNEILSPIYRVDLTMPSGTVRTLTNVTDWYEIGELLHICGTNTEGELITSESGTYTVTVYCDGYQTMTKTVRISGQTAVSENTRLYSYSDDDFGIDALSGATGGSGSGGDSESGSGGGSINANVIFDHDLLSNALILTAIGCENADASAVVARWEEFKPLYVMDDEAETLYNMIDYYNAVLDAYDDGQYLSFAQFAQRGEGITQNRPYQAKRVLEDGLLGSVFRFSDAVGKAAPQLQGTEGALRQDLVLTCESDPEYISKITTITLDGYSLRSDDYLKHYEFSEDKSSLTIYAVTQGTAGGDLKLTRGEHTLHIEAEGYQAADVTLSVDNTLEQFALSLSSNPASDDESTVYYTGQNVVIQAACDEDDDTQAELRGDFLKNLTGVTLRYPDGTSKGVTSDMEGQIGGDENYTKEDYTIILQKGLFDEAGDYVVTIFANGYTPKTLDFTIEQRSDEDIPNEEDLLAVPEVKEARYVEQRGGTSYYRIVFTGLTETELETYLDVKSEDLTVTVNGKSYSKSSMLGLYEKTFKASADTGYGSYDSYDFSTEAFAKGENTIIIEAKGYETLEFTITLAADGSVAGDTKDPDEDIPGEDIPEEGKLPEVKEARYVQSSYEGGVSYYRVVFTGLTETELGDYLNTRAEDIAVTVNGQSYTRAGILGFPETSFITSGDVSYGVIDSLDFTAKAFVPGEDNTIVIEVKGYETLEFTITLAEDGSVVGNLDDDIPDEDIPEEGGLPVATGVEKKTDDWADTWYRVEFSGLEKDQLKEYLTNDITSVTVNETEYKKVSQFWNSTTSYKSSGEYGEIKYLDFTHDGFSEGDNVIRIEADGYEDLEFTVIVADGSAVLGVPTARALSLSLSLENEDDEEVGTVDTNGTTDDIDETVSNENVSVDTDDDSADDVKAPEDDDVEDDDIVDDDITDDDSDDEDNDEEGKTEDNTATDKTDDTIEDEDAVDDDTDSEVKDEDSDEDAAGDSNSDGKPSDDETGSDKNEKQDDVYKQDEEADDDAADNTVNDDATDTKNTAKTDSTDTEI